MFYLVHGIIPTVYLSTVYLFFVLFLDYSYNKEKNVLIYSKKKLIIQELLLHFLMKKVSCKIFMKECDKIITL